MRAALRRFVAAVGSDPGDPESLRLQKRLLVTLSLMVIPAGCLWSLAYVAFGEPLAGSIPGAYAVASAVSLFLFAWRRQFRWFLRTQLLLILLLPFLLQLALGGFVNASAVIIWSLLAPLGAMLIGGRRQSVPWFLGFVAMVILVRVMQPSLHLDNNLTTGTVAALFVMNIAAVGAIVFVTLHYFVGERDAAFSALEAEQDRSERLLLNILPQEVAALLKDDQRLIVQRYPSASVLFADLVGFTPLSVDLTPEAMVGLLNEVFSAFDGLTAAHGCEKIRTIGDSYMVASGVPVAHPDHAAALARLALAMRYHVASSERRLQFRIGMSSGPLVAGIIGTAKFQYDLWGDTVNTASRMESHGLPGKIQITRSTFELIADHFVCEPRGVIDIKGKGPMETWFLEAER